MVSNRKWRGRGCFKRNFVIGQDCICNSKRVCFCTKLIKIGEILKNIEKIHLVQSHLFCSIWFNKRLVLSLILHMQSSPITEFLSKHPLPLHFQMLPISQWMELGCWYWAQCFCFFKLFQNPTCFAQFGATGDSFWLTYAILSNSRFSYQTPTSFPILNSCHFSTDGARMLRLDSMSLFFSRFSRIAPILLDLV